MNLLWAILLVLTATFSGAISQVNEIAEEKSFLDTLHWAVWHGDGWSHLCLISSTTFMVWFFYEMFIAED